jgi:hypothetical protein
VLDDSLCPVTRLSIRFIYQQSSPQRLRHSHGEYAASAATQRNYSQWLFILLLGVDPLEDELIVQRHKTQTDCTFDPTERFAYNLSWFALAQYNRSLYCHLPATSNVRNRIRSFSVHVLDY